MASKGAFAPPEPQIRRVQDDRPLSNPAARKAEPAKAAPQIQTQAPVHAPRETTPDDHGTVQVQGNDERRTQQEGRGTATSPVPTNTSETIVIDGPLAGFSVEEYVAGVVNGIHDAMGEVDLLTAGCALDQALGEFLNVAYHAEGAKAAQAMGVRFCETALPFAQLQPEPITYGEMKRLVKK
jgi:hypothetical protein